MGKSLVIVESPTKAKTLSRFLGGGYKVIASVGHIKDLPKNGLGVDVENDFAPKYEIVKGKRKVLTEIKKEAQEAEIIYLAPDPDREGEAIAWHIAGEIKKKGKPIHRVLFHEITRQAVTDALHHPLELNRDKFESQQARRILDRLVGYQLSPLLWDKVRRGLSAGRVQSVAVKLVVEREREIRAFKSEEYWTVAVQYRGSKEPPFWARLHRVNGKKPDLKNGDEAAKVTEELKSNPHRLSRIEKKERRRHPVPPFITSKLQQEASRRLRLSPQQTMMIAQQLYEGVELGEEGMVGLITYMRTDSTRISEVALKDVREFIKGKYGPAYLPENPVFYKNRKGSQDAHEAIRPSSILNPPEKVKPFLKREQYKLYQLIWDRFVASQMMPAVFDATTFEIACASHLLRVTGQVLKFAGFTKVYTERFEEGERKPATEGNGDTETEEGSEGDVVLPELLEGEALNPLNFEQKQNFTQPPYRYSEAMLVKELEEKGIGRPSTYASILGTIQDKRYVHKEKGRLFPNELGEIVTDLLGESFPEIMDYAFTAGMEEKLDEVEEGKVSWLSLLKVFYDPFQKTLTAAKTAMRNVKREEKPTGLHCPKCQSPLVLKWGRNGSFVGCSAYPECSFTSEYSREEDGSMRLVETVTETNEVCPSCGSPMTVKSGRFGKFLACSTYPACKTTMPVKIGVKCPEPGCTGDLIEKRTKKGKLFFGCNRYPSCKFASWDRPRSTPCPTCQNPYMVEKFQSDGTMVLRCPSCQTVKELPKPAEPAALPSAAGE